MGIPADEFCKSHDELHLDSLLYISEQDGYLCRFCGKTWLASESIPTEPDTHLTLPDRKGVRYTIRNLWTSLLVAAAVLYGASIYGANDIKTITIEQSYRIGATCSDGSSSAATGSGACSWHGGVREWSYSVPGSTRKVQGDSWPARHSDDLTGLAFLALIGGGFFYFTDDDRKKTPKV